MRRRPLIFLLLLGFFLHQNAYPETHRITLNQDHAEPAAFGTYFFGFGNDDEKTGIWPCNFWSNFDADKFAQDAATLKLEGGNAAIVLFPFFDASAPDASTAARFNQLKKILDVCESHGIGLTLRLGYAWDNGFSNSTYQRQVATLVDPEQRKLWYRYCELTYSIASQYKCFRGGFISWEDYWGLLAGASFSEPERRKWASYIHYNQDAVPARDDPAMEDFFAFFDQLFGQEFFLSSQGYFPGLGMEVRMDDDPIYEHGVMKKYFVHTKQFTAPTLRDVYVYWGPFMGARTEGDLISADTATSLLLRALEKARSLSPPQARLIMAQFNYKDNTPGFSRNSRILPDELESFVKKSSLILSQLCTGVYTWSNTSYYHNAINNGTFSSGSAFWEFAHALAGVDQGRACASIFPDGSISQRIDPNTAVSAGLIGCEKATVEFFAKIPTATAPCSVSLGNQTAQLVLAGKGLWQRYAVDFEKPTVAGQFLRISTPGGSLVRDFVLANHKQEIGATEQDSSRDRIYADLAWELSRGQVPPSQPMIISGITQDNWIISQATFVAPAISGHYQITVNLTVPDFIREQKVQVAIQPASSSSTTDLVLIPGTHQLVVSGSSTCQQVYLTLSFSRRQRPSATSPDLRELAAHVDSVEP